MPLVSLGETHELDELPPKRQDKACPTFVAQENDVSWVPLLSSIEILLERERLKLQQSLGATLNSVIALLQADEVARCGANAALATRGLSAGEEDLFSSGSKDLPVGATRQQTIDSNSSKASKASASSSTIAMLKGRNNKSFASMLSSATLGVDRERQISTASYYSEVAMGRLQSCCEDARELNVILPEDVSARRRRRSMASNVTLDVSEDDSGVGKYARTKSMQIETALNSNICDWAMGAFICLNVFVMFMELEQKGYEAAVKLGIYPASAFVSSSAVFFAIAGHIFNGVFALELVLRLVAEGPRAFRNYTVFFDALVVANSGIDYLLRYGIDYHGTNLNFLRMLRFAKLAKLLHSFRAAPVFSDLRILVKTLVNCLMGLVWASVLLFAILISTGMFLSQMLQGTMVDEQINHELRAWVWQFHGTASRSAYSLFEVTLSGSWPLNARRMIEEVSGWYVIFWIAFIIVVWFAVVRVLTAVFLQKTMKIARLDDELMQNEKLGKGVTNYVNQIADFLRETDVDNDAKMNQEELQIALDHEDLQQWLNVIDLASHDVMALFAVLADEEGQVTHDDLVGGILRLSGGIRAIDTVVIMHSQRQHARELEKVVQGLQHTVESGLRRCSAALESAF